MVLNKILEKQLTVPAPLNGAASVRKIFFGPMHVVKIDKIHLNALILGRFKGCGYNSRAAFNGVGTVVNSYHIPSNFYV